MCWNFNISIISAIYGMIVSYYLYIRGRKRDKYYSRYLFTFTFTQIIDAMLWYTNDNIEELKECSIYQFQILNYPKNNQVYNYFITKLLLPISVFFQYAMQCLYPSNLLSKYQKKFLIFIYLIPTICMSISFGCTILYQSNFPINHYTLLWGGDLSKPSIIVNEIVALIHSGLITLIFYLLMKKEKKILLIHVIPFYTIILFLFITEGTITLGSKWCWYCLIYSVIYITEPLWY